MALTVETGAGIELADSYVAQGTITTYWGNRTNSAFAALWTAASTGVKDGGAREATAYIDSVYGAYFRGVRAGYTQGLAWPRTGALDDTGYPLPALPPELVAAVCELAGRAITSPLAADTARGGAVKRKRVKAGPVETETEWADGATAETKYGFVAGILAPILTGQPGNATWLWK